MVHVPLDIVDMVLAAVSPGETSQWGCNDGAHQEKKDLSACRLVCRAWKPFATSHLFRDVCYSFNYDVEEASIESAETLLITEENNVIVPARPSRWIRWKEYYFYDLIPLKKLDDFRTFLEMHQDIRSLIHRLRLSGCDSGNEESTIDPQLLIRVIDMLPNLRHLVLWDVAVHDVWCNIYGGLPREPGDVTTAAPFIPIMKNPLVSLVVHHWEEPRVRNQLDTIRLLQHFSAAEELDIWTASMSSDYDAAVANYLPLAMHPRTLVLHSGESPNQVLNYLASQPELLASVRKLILKPCFTDSDVLNDFCQSGIKGTLTELELDGDGWLSNELRQCVYIWE